MGKNPNVYRFEGVEESMPKNMLASGPGFKAMEQRLAGAKKMKPMKPSVPRKRSASPVMKSVAPNMKPSGM